MFYVIQFFLYNKLVVGFKALNFENLLQTSSLCECSGYEAFELKECVIILHDLYLSRKAASFKAIREKYKQHKVLIFFIYFVIIYFNSDFYKLSDLKSSTGTVQVCSKLAFSSTCAKSLLWNSVMLWGLSSIGKDVTIVKCSNLMEAVVF